MMSALYRTIHSWLPLVLLCLLLSPQLQAEDELNEQAYLDQVLAPIALYPDSVLSHILIASTYPLEVVQASRWASEHESLSSEQALQQVEQEPWDPSVKALVAFPDLLQRMSDDLDWLEQLGEAFLNDEAWVMQSIQQLREQAYAHGSLDEVEHIVVQREQNVIVIEPKQPDIIYVPYYNTRVIYGDWHWPHHQPYYWHYPGAYYTHSAFYWGPYYRVTPGFYFSSFHWHQRHVIVNHHHFYQPPRAYPRRVVHVHNGKRWQHNPVHRRGVVYRREALNHRYSDRPRSYTREDRGPAREWRRPPRRQSSGDVTTSYRQNASERPEQRRYVRQQSNDRTATRSESLRQPDSQRQQRNTERRSEYSSERGTQRNTETGNRTIRQQANLEQRRQQLADRQQHDIHQGSASTRSTHRDTTNGLEQRQAQLAERQQASRNREATAAQLNRQTQRPARPESQPQNRVRSQPEARQQTSPAIRQQQVNTRAQTQPAQTQNRVPSPRQQAPERVIRQSSPQQSAPQQVRQSSRPAQAQTPPSRPQSVQRSTPPSRPQATESRGNRSSERRQRQID
ncbi:DUF3300 domain-containing protein [Alkalimonas collagenimarina]|uniref:DUF3300 domain-containing protein n=1 Tax=Alkalimonas collagenimarina TaxID=400390 RepID=A0ABT9H1C6_9GAMM|nr:DUF3300 domain-containing protein [Alkalimonas collagenimarina]MDP4536874.1 DUF3300 domain-containing protein [Alkalimonas collagenimarina]